MIVVSPASGLVAIDVNAAASGDIEQQRVAHERLRAHDGFVSASLHRSLDGAQLATYAQWETAAAARAAQPASLVYEVVHVQKAPAAEPSIVTGTAPLTLIVVMTCEPAEQDGLVTYLISIAVEHSANPGFLSCSIHRGLDGTRVAEYIQWTDRAALGAMAAKPASQAHFARVKPRSSSAMYEVVSALESGARTA